MWETLHHVFLGWNMENLMFGAWKYAPHVSRWNEENFIFQARNSMAREPGLNCREIHISGRKFCAPSFQAERQRISYFRQETQHPKFPGWNAKGVIFQAGNYVPQLSRMKCGEFHNSVRKPCAPSFQAEIWRISLFRQVILCPSFQSEMQRFLISHAGNSAPQVVGQKCIMCHISDSKLYALRFQAEMLKVSYFRQETLHPKAEGCNV